MNILAFDTCFDACSVAVSVGGEVASERTLMRRGHAEALHPMIARTMARAGVSFTALDRIAVTHGPGTFTGTRVGIAAALGLSFANQTPVVTYSALQCVARAAIAALGSACAEIDAIVVARDARRDSVYIEITDVSGNERLPPRLMTMTDARTLLSGKRYAVVGNAASLLADPNSNPNPDPEGSAALAPQIRHSWPPGIEEPDARHLLWDAASRQPTPAPRPLYLRPPDAVPSATAPLAHAAAEPPGRTDAPR